jgi:hypothetical protein
MSRMIALALAAALVWVTPAAAQQKGTLAPGASVEVATDADSFTSFNIDHDGKKAVAVQIVGPAGTKELTVEPNQKVGYSGKYAGKKVTIVNKGDVAINYDVN